MSLAYADLTLPLPGSRSAREVLSRALTRLPGDLRAMNPAGLTTPAAKDALAVAQGFVARAVASARDPFAAALLASLRRPTVGALVRCMREDLARGRASARTNAYATELAATLAIELSLAGALTSSVSVRSPPSRVLCLGARRTVVIPPGTELLRIDRGVIAFEQNGHRSEHPLTEIAAQGAWRVVVEPMALALDDNNPLAIYGLSAEDPPNAVNLGEKPVDDWLSMLRECVALTATYLPELRAEMDLHVQQIVPIGTDPEIHRSASYRQALGTTYLSLHPSLMTMTEALIHESQHDKLHALMELDPVLVNDSVERFHSPLRRDPRPLRGLLLAVHAFLPVERLYESMIMANHPLASQPSFLKRFEQVRSVNRDSAEPVFAHARTTPAGAALLNELRRELTRAT